MMDILNFFTDFWNFIGLIVVIYVTGDALEGVVSAWRGNDG